MVSFRCRVAVLLMVLLVFFGSEVKASVEMEYEKISMNTKIMVPLNVKETYEGAINYCRNNENSTLLSYDTPSSLSSMEDIDLPKGMTAWVGLRRVCGKIHNSDDKVVKKYRAFLEVSTPNKDCYVVVNGNEFKAEDCKAKHQVICAKQTQKKNFEFTRMGYYFTIEEEHRGFHLAIANCLRRNAALVSPSNMYELNVLLGFNFSQKDKKYYIDAYFVKSPVSREKGRYINSRGDPVPRLPWRGVRSGGRNCVVVNSDNTVSPAFCDEVHPPFCKAHRGPTPEYAE